MSGLDDRLRRDLERLAEPQEAGRGVLERVQAKKTRRRWIRRTQVAGLVVAVVSGTAAGTYGLSRMFGAADTSEIGRTAPLARNGLIAFVHQEHLWVIRPDGTGWRQLSGLIAGQHLAWSPDGERIAFSEGEHSENPRIIALDIATGEYVSNLTERIGADMYLDPAWSPGGSRVALTAAFYPEDGKCDGLECLPYLRTSIWVVNADGRDPREITDRSTIRATSPTWLSEDTIAFAGLPMLDASEGSLPQPAPRILEVGAGGGGKPQTMFTIPLSITGGPAWSPDGDRIAFSGIAEGPDGLFVMDVEGGEPVLVVAPGPGARDGSGGIQDVAWSPDGRRLLYTKLGTDEPGVYTANLDGTDERFVVGGCCAAWQPLPIGASPVSPTPVLIGPLPPTSSSQSTPPVSPPLAPPTVTPPVIPPPVASPPPPFKLAQECDGSTIVAEFDGNGSGGPDGKPDRATVARSFCLFEARSPVAGPFDEFAIDVEWGGGAGGIWPLLACAPPSNTCRISGAKDIDGDGLAELALTVHEGASTSFVELYRLPTREPGPIRFIVAPPGDPPAFAPGEAARFAQSGTVTHQDLMSCSTAGDGTAEISAISADLSRDQRIWIVHETTFTVEEEVFLVASVEDHETRVDATGVSPLSRSPCFGDSTTEP